jgi:hypothetical protein
MTGPSSPRAHLAFRPVARARSLTLRVQKDRGQTLKKTAPIFNARNAYGARRPSNVFAL